MLGDWRYKVLAVPAGTAVTTLTDGSSGVTAETGDPPVETTLRGRPGNGLYAYMYPLPLAQLRAITDDFDHVDGEMGTLLKHKPRNGSPLDSVSAGGVTTRVQESVLCTLDRGSGEELIEWIRETY